MRATNPCPSPLSTSLLKPLLDACAAIGWQGFADDTSGIRLVEAGLGSLPHLTDILDLRAVGGARDGYTMLPLAEAAIRTSFFFATVRVTDGAGLRSNASINQPIRAINASLQNQGPTYCI